MNYKKNGYKKLNDCCFNCVSFSQHHLKGTCLKHGKKMTIKQSKQYRCKDHDKWWGAT